MSLILLLDSQKTTQVFDLFNRADGALGKGWTAPSWSISGNKISNALTLGAELYTNPGAEGSFVSGLAPNWQHMYYSGAEIDETAIKHSGGHAQRLTTAAGQREYVGPAYGAVTNGAWYLARQWVNWLSGLNTRLQARYSSGVFSNFLGADPQPSLNAWKYYDLLIKANDTSLTVIADTGTGAADVALDDFSLKALTFESIFAIQDAGTADVIASASFTVPQSLGIATSGNPAGMSGVVINLDSKTNPQNWVMVFWSGNRLILGKVVNRVYTAIQNNLMPHSETTFSANELLELRKHGTTYQVFYEGVQLGSDQVISDASIINNTLAGLIDISGGTFDSFACRKYGDVLNPHISHTYDHGVTYPTGNGVLSLRFDDGRDDGTAGTFSVLYPLLTARGLAAGFALIRNCLYPGSSYISIGQAMTMQSAGMEILCHSRTHGSDPPDFATFMDEVATTAEEMRLMGFNIDSFVQPGTWVVNDQYNMIDSAWYGTPGDALLRRYFSSYEGYIEPFVGPTNQAFALPRTNKWGVQHVTGDTMTLANLETLVDALISNHQGTTILFHSFNINAGGGKISLADFTTFLDYVKTKKDGGTLSVLTPTQQLFATPV